MTVQQLIDELNTIPLKERDEEVILCNSTFIKDGLLEIKEIDGWMDTINGILIFLIEKGEQYDIS